MAGKEIVSLVGFSAGGEDFCIDILKVQEIIRMVDITRLPNTPEYVEGVINLRGHVIPVIDFRKRCKLQAKTEWAPEHRRIVVAAIGARTAGLIVDKVSQVVKLELQGITPTPEVAMGLNGDFISGIGKDCSGRLLILLNLEKLITQDELVDLEQAAA